jgi:hypothetical protein
VTALLDQDLRLLQICQLSAPILPAALLGRGVGAHLDEIIGSNSGSA